jgi:hypothetical protein
MDKAQAHNAQRSTLNAPSLLVLFLFALLPRALAGPFLTVDEAYHWLDRVQRFITALAAGDLAGTNLIGHPGVTTLWLGAAGELIYRTLVETGWLPADDALQRALTRLPLAAVNALCIALAFPLLRRLLDGRIALLATLLWAGEPFLVAHGQLLHLDALLTSFMTLSLLAALVASGEWKAQNAEQVTLPPSSLTTLHSARRYWALSSFFGGLALLTKSPAVLLLPMVGLVALLQNSRQKAEGKSHPASLILLGTWLAVAAVVWLALWPAAWLDPLGAAGRVFLQASADGGSPHGWGNFFLGQSVDDPGSLFYPLVIALRLAPWTLAGLLIGCGVLLAGLRNNQAPPADRLQRRTLLLLLLFALGFLVAMSIPPKKFDRYALPIFPTLTILAAFGLAQAAGWTHAAIRALGTTNHATWNRHSLPKIARIRASSWLPVRRSIAALTAIAWAAIVAVLAGNLALHHPYHLAYFNPLLGGGPVAARLIPVGWGEGYDLVGTYITAQPNGRDRPVAARYEPVLNPFVPNEAVPLAWAQTPGQVDYAVVYIDQLQRNDKPETFRPLLEQFVPIHTVRINGIEYAYVYQIPPPVARPLPADFGSGMRLRGYGLEARTVRSTGALTLTLEWVSRAREGQDYALFAHVFDASGTRVGQVDVPPGGAPTSRWEPGHYVSLVQRIPLPPDLPAGEYRVAIGVYDPQTSIRLPLRSPPRPALPEAGPDALVLDPFVVP